MAAARVWEDLTLQYSRTPSSPVQALEAPPSGSCAHLFGKPKAGGAALIVDVRP